MSYVYVHPDNPEKDFQILDILNKMRDQGIHTTFIYSLMEHCQRYEGIRDLMQMWFEETNLNEKGKIIADLQECLNDIADLPQKPEERPYLHYHELVEVQHDVLAFKKQLREEVDKQGGINELARKTGIPQPSLSRFFSSASMPRRTTLYKIAKALNLPESSVGFKWVR